MAGWPLAAAMRLEESPGSTETRCRITSGGGDPRESATESTPPTGSNARVRVKWCGKSAPRLRQRRRHGKPHREQDQIGTVHACFRVAVRVGRARRAARRVPEECPSLRKKDRTRLTGHLTQIPQVLFGSPPPVRRGRWTRAAEQRADGGGRHPPRHDASRIPPPPRCARHLP